MRRVERWGMYEWAGQGRADGNPFVDYDIWGTFHTPAGDVRVPGFYDGDGLWRVRFMPQCEGEHRCEIAGSFSDQTFEDAFLCEPASEGNHGPVRVRGMHFEYADGTPYRPFGTTCYVWELQSDALREKTLEELGKGYFNKIRYCVFPKHYLYNLHEPISYPFEGTPCQVREGDAERYPRFGVWQGNRWDFTRPNPRHFRNVERSILQLQAIGVEADLIMMHPYDRWGFSEMPPEADDLYWRYAVARFAAYRNVWWSLANEYDLFTEKTTEDWEWYGHLIRHYDPYRHLTSIHNCHAFYDHRRPWITHCSIQRQETYRSSELVNEWRERFFKPVVLDEIAYEGNIQYGWGNISGEEMVRRFWEAAVRGGYPGHGETYMNENEVLWWSHGGVLHGESPKRFHLLKDILEETPGCGLAPWENTRWDEVCGVPENEFHKPVKSYYLFYYSFMRPSFRDYYFDDETEFSVRVIDTWNMEVTDAGTHKGRFRIELPGRQYMAVQIRKTDL